MITKTLVFATFFLVTIRAQSINQPVNRPVIPGELTALIEQADKLVVLESPMRDAKILFTSCDRKDLVELKEAAVVAVPIPGPGFHCMCIGTPAIQLYKNNEKLALITNHHGMTIRCAIWSSDADLVDSEKWLKWFDTRGISGPRAEVDSNNARYKQDQHDEAKWTAAMPKSLKAFWDPEIKYSSGRSVNWSRLEAALSNEFPVAQDRVLALLSWFGEGAFQSYEAVTETLLLKYSTPEIIKAIQSTPLSSGQIEGAGRLFAGWEFLRKRENELKLLPTSIKAEVLKHIDGSIAERSFDSDWIARKQAASSAHYSETPNALEAMRVEAEHGNAQAQYILGICIYEGLGVKKDCSEGVKWIRKAAEQGIIQAQYNHGVCHYKGQCIRQNFREAVKWFSKAAEQGHATAQYNLGYCYAHRYGIGLNYNEAAKWYRMAALQGIPEAQHNLGFCYVKGQGVPQSWTEAYVWFSLAAMNGLEEGKRSRDLAVEQLLPQALRQANSQAEKLLAEIRNRQQAK